MWRRHEPFVFKGDKAMKTVAKTKKSKMNLQGFINWMWTELQAVNKQVEADQQKAAEDLHWFLTWGSNACEHAARQKYLGIYLASAKEWLESKKTAEQFLEYISNNLLQESAVVVKSSGIMNNVMETFDRSTKASIVNELRCALKYNSFQ